MGMFDSLYDSEGREWQTKAFNRALATFDIGSIITGLQADNCQVEVLAHIDGNFVRSYATIINGRLSEVPAKRDESLPLFSYSGSLREEATNA